jgi:hypothetical protein
MKQRELVQLAHDFDTNRLPSYGPVALSIKLDGGLGFWDGGCTIGKHASEIPWASTRPEARPEWQISTGLWTRYGHIISAPEWFTSRLPTGLMMVGELYMGKRMLQKTLSLIRTKGSERADEWKKIRFMAFDCPSVVNFSIEAPMAHKIFKDRMGTNPLAGVRPLLAGANPRTPLKFIEAYETLTLRHAMMNDPAGSAAPFQVNPQVFTQISPTIDAEIAEFAAKAEANGEEGIMIRTDEPWIPYRAYRVMKLKVAQEEVVTVVGTYEAKDGMVGLIGGMTCLTDDGITVRVGGGIGLGERDSFRASTPKKIRIRYKYRSDENVPVEPRMIAIVEGA